MAVAALSGVSAAESQPGARTASWKQVSTPNPGRFGAYGRWLVDVSASSSKSVWADGFTHAGPLLIHWNGKRWSTSKAPRPQNNAGTLKWVSALSRKNVWAFGLQGSSFPQKLWAIKHSATGWHNEHLGSLPDGFRAQRVRAYSNKSIWAVGSDQELHGQLAAAAHWDGHTWTEVMLNSGTGETGDLWDITRVPGTNTWMAVGSTLSPQIAGLYVKVTTSGITKMSTTGATYLRGPNSVVAFSPTNAWAVGVDTTGEYYEPIVEHWDGTTWSSESGARVPGKQLSSGLVGLASGAKNELVAVGSSRTRDGGTRLLAERYNGRTWQLLKPVNVKTGGEWQNQFFAITSVPGAKGLYWAVGDHGNPAPGPSGTAGDIRGDHTLAERCLC